MSDAQPTGCSRHPTVIKETDMSAFSSRDSAFFLIQLSAAPCHPPSHTDINTELESMALISLSAGLTTAKMGDVKWRGGIFGAVTACR